MIAKAIKRQILTLYANQNEPDEIAKRFSLTEEDVLSILRSDGVAIRGEDPKTIRDQRMAYLEHQLADSRTSYLKMRDQRDHYIKRTNLLEAELRRRNIRVP